MAAAVVAGMVAMAFAAFGLLLLEQLSHGGHPFMLSCAGFLGGGAVVVVSGTVLPASAGAAARLLLALG